MVRWCAAGMFAWSIWFQGLANVQAETPAEKPTSETPQKRLTPAEREEQRRQELLKKFDKDGDGKLNEAERKAMREEFWRRRNGEAPLEEAGSGGTKSGEQPPKPGDPERPKEGQPRKDSNFGGQKPGGNAGGFGVGQGRPAGGLNGNAGGAAGANGFNGQGGQAGKGGQGGAGVGGFGGGAGGFGGEAGKSGGSASGAIGTEKPAEAGKNLPPKGSEPGEPIGVDVPKPPTDLPMDTGVAPTEPSSNSKPIGVNPEKPQGNEKSPILTREQVFGGANSNPPPRRPRRTTRN